MSWLLHFMIPKIGEDFLSLNKTKDIWDIVSETYSRQGNIAQVYDLQRHVNRLNQAEVTFFLGLLILVLIMTVQSNLFSSYTPYTGPNKVKIADGTFSSISRITHDLNCSITFSYSFCAFQDLQTRMTIDSDRETNGLYFFNLLAPT